MCMVSPETSWCVLISLCGPFHPYVLFGVVFGRPSMSVVQMIWAQAALELVCRACGYEAAVGPHYWHDRLCNRAGYTA